MAKSKQAPNPTKDAQQLHDALSSTVSYAALSSGAGGSLVGFRGPDGNTSPLANLGNMDDATAGYHMVARPYIYKETAATIKSPGEDYEDLLRFIPTKLHASIRDFSSTADIDVFLQNAVNSGRKIRAQPGKYNCAAPIILSNTPTDSKDPFSPDRYDSGLVLVGAGMNKTMFYAAFSDEHKGLFNFTADKSDKYRLGTHLSQFSIFPASQIRGTHGIVMNANFFGVIEQVRVQSLPGHGFYSPLCPEYGINPDRYQNSVLHVRNSFFNACGGNGFFGASGLGMAATSFENCFFYNNLRSGVVIGTVLQTFKNCAFAGNGASNDGGGLLVDNLNAGPLHLVVENCEFESNHGQNVWLRSLLGGVSHGMRLNAKTYDQGRTMTPSVQIRIGDKGQAVRSMLFIADKSKSDTLGNLPVSMYKIQGNDVAGVQIWEPLTGDNTRNLQILDTSESTGVLDGVKLIHQGVETRSKAFLQKATVKAYAKDVQIIPSGVSTILKFDQTVVDSAGNWDAQKNAFLVSSNAGVGLYKVRVEVTAKEQRSIGQVTLQILRNNIVLAAKSINIVPNTSASFELEDEVLCTELGTLLSVKLSQTTGIDLLLEGGLQSSRLSIRRLD